MEKILTISIAAYNVGPYIKENLDSIVSSEYRDDIEVFIVDDGGKDGTYGIAMEYEKNYPGIVYAIHKENGGYGSVQNYSFAHATGKYFKILDGDDWMDTEGLTKLIEYLRKAEVDAVITNYKKGPDKTNLKIFDFKKHVSVNETFTPDKLQTAIGMWAITYKTDVIRKSGVFLPEHTLYTDRIYATVPFASVKEIIYLDFSVYCYRIGRDGQSVSRESRIKHIDEYMEVAKILCNNDTVLKANTYILLKTVSIYKTVIRALLLLDSNQMNKNKIIDFENEIKGLSKDVYYAVERNKSIMGRIILFLRRTNYKGYWIFRIIPKKIIDF